LFANDIISTIKTREGITSNAEMSRYAFDSKILIFSLRKIEYMEGHFARKKKYEFILVAKVPLVHKEKE